MNDDTSDPVGNNLTFSNNLSHSTGGGLANYTNSMMTLINAKFSSTRGKSTSSWGYGEVEVRRSF